MIRQSFKHNIFEQLRNAFLASILRRDHEATLGIYREISHAAGNASELSEIDQKALNQIQRILKKFSRHISPEATRGMQAPRGAVRRKLAETVRRQTANPSPVDFDQWRGALALPEDSYRTLLESVTSLQITMGCSNHCRRCNEWALAGPRKHFTFDAVKTLLAQLFSVGNTDFALYCASDPLDWQDGGKNVTDIIRFMADQGYASRYGLLTKIPRGTEKTVEKLLLMNADFAVSITEKNRKTVEGIEAATGKKLQAQHDTEDLLIPAGLDEDFSTVKSSITDNYGVEITPEGAFLIIPTYTSALNPTGQSRLGVTRDTPFYPVRKTGREAMATEFFKPVSARTPNGAAFRPKALLDPQVENILLCNASESCTPPGMMNLEEYFKSYAPAAVTARKNLMPAVERKLREEGLSEDDPLFLRQMETYRMLCTEQGAREFKVHAISWFLSHVCRYLKRNPDKGNIVRHLRREDRERYLRKPEIPPHGHPGDPETRIKHNPDGYAAFQELLFTLLEDPFDREIEAFILAHPSVHDPRTDRFTAPEP